MYNSRVMHLPTRPSVLDDSIKSSFTTRASDSIYYGRFPYKVKFDTEKLRTIASEDETPFRRFENDLRWEFRDFACSFSKEHKVFFNGNHRVYLSDPNDLDWTLSMYGDWVDVVQGPIHEKHLDMLYDLDCKLVSKVKGWYGKYDYRMEVWASYTAIRNLWLSTGGNIQQHKKQKNSDLQDDIINFVEQIEAQDYDARINFTNLEYYTNLTMFFYETDKTDILAFRNLMLNDFRVNLTRAIYE